MLQVKYEFIFLFFHFFPIMLSFCFTKKSRMFKNQRHNFSNLISHHHPTEKCLKKDSPFAILREQSQEESIESSHSDSKLKNQSLSSANSDLDNDGNHNGRGYLSVIVF